jgi:hypothetical protein
MGDSKTPESAESLLEEEMSETHGPLKPERKATGSGVMHELRTAHCLAATLAHGRTDGVLPAKEVTDATFHAATF